MAFGVIEPEHLKFKHERKEMLSSKATTTKKREKTYHWRQGRAKQKLKWQQCGFLNCYDFAYARRDTVNHDALS